jgi:hypothetical protein
MKITPQEIDTFMEQSHPLNPARHFLRSALWECANMLEVEFDWCLVELPEGLKQENVTIHYPYWEVGMTMRPPMGVWNCWRTISKNEMELSIMRKEDYEQLFAQQARRELCHDMGFKTWYVMKMLKLEEV